MTPEDQEGRAAARNREFLGVQTGRAITDSDLDTIENGAATVAYSTVLGGLRDPHQDIGAVALMFGIEHWRASKRTEALWWPLAEEGSDAFRFNILWQMSVIDPAGPYPQLRKLPIERARPQDVPAGDLVSMAFNAGLAAGALGTASRQDVARGGGASRSRVTEMPLSYTQDRKDAAEERRDLLLSFARAKIEADPPHLDC
ncbi:hypothetical protein D3C72_315750 [compost metagenome]